jgi:DNA-binding NtrC family response regulator
MPETFTDHSTQNPQPAPFASFREIAPALLFTAAVLNAADKISQTNLPVLVAGEKGLGQPYLSLLVHESGFTKTEPFLELHVRPNREKESLDTLYALILADIPGQAFSGTLHIHGLENASPRLQSALLHMLDEQKLLTERNQFRFEGRISASIHKTLDEIASQGAILHELLYKLTIAPILLKPLRERRKDIPLLAETFIKACGQRLPGPPKQFCDDAINCLLEHSWPGNLPELESVIYRSVLFSSALNLERQNILFTPALPESLSAEIECFVARD